MAEVIRMPRMSDTMEEGNIVAWHKKIGDNIESGDLLAEIETDKATMEFESLWEGTLLHIGIESGSVPVNAVIAVIGEEGEDYEAALANAGAGVPKQVIEQIDVPEQPTVKKEIKKVTITQPTLESTPETTTKSVENGRIKSSPLARHMAEKEGLDLSIIKGSGDGGRVIKRDVVAFLESGMQQAMATAKIAAPTVTKSAVKTQPVTTSDEFIDTPLSPMRKTIARRLGESKYSAPHFYLTVEIDMDNAMFTRKRINEIAPTKISFNDLVVKAAAASLQQHPVINSSWMGDFIRENKAINIGVAVAVEEGLVVPVIRNANHKTLSQINGEVRELAGKAKDKKIQLEEMQGNTFTISNLGMFGIEEFTAIINPPDACIMAVGSIVQKPVVKDGELAVGNRMKVTLSCDHRVVDGASGAKFLQTFKAILEDPIRMLV